MRNDQIFVLLLVIILPMSGCFDGAVGDAEGTDDATDGTTVINNYHNNTTIVYNNTTADVGPEYFVVGGTVDETTINEPRTGQTGIYYYPFNFSTTSGQTVYLHTLVVDGVNAYAYLNSDCGEGGQWSVSSTSTNAYEDHLGYWIAGSAFDCQHSFTILANINSNGQPPFYFSAIYSIEDMTVMPLQS